MKAVILGDNLIPAQMILSRCDPLRDAGYEIEALDWLAADRNALTQRNLNVERNGPEAEPLPAGALEAVRDAGVLLTHFCPVPRSLIESASVLQAVGLARGGWENVDLVAATARGVPVIHIVGRNANAVAEHTVGLILNEMRNMARSHAAMMAGTWYNRLVDPAVTYELAGKTVGLIGFGAIGQLLARRLSGFEPRLLVHDPFVSDELIEAAGGEAVSLETLLSQSDILSLHARLSRETEGMIGRDELALMKPTAYLINTARAGLIDEDALVESLQSGAIAGAALDVFTQEPLPPASPLLALDNVTLNSHIAGTTLDSLRLSVDLMVRAVLDYLENDKRDWIINPEALHHGRDEF